MHYIRLLASRQSGRTGSEVLLYEYLLDIVNPPMASKELLFTLSLLISEWRKKFIDALRTEDAKMCKSRNAISNSFCRIVPVLPVGLQLKTRAVVRINLLQFRSTYRVDPAPSQTRFD